MWEYTKTINGSRFQATLKASEFELNESWWSGAQKLKKARRCKSTKKII